MPLSRDNEVYCGVLIHYRAGNNSWSLHQILRMSGQFHIMIGQDDQRSHQQILSYHFLQDVTSQ